MDRSFEQDQPGTKRMKFRRNVRHSPVTDGIHHLFQVEKQVICSNSS